MRAEGALAEWGYVAASRARAETRLYAVGPELAADAGLAHAQPEPTTRPLAGALSRTAAEPPALERLATAGPGERALAREEPGLSSPPRLGPSPSRREPDERPAASTLAFSASWRRAARPTPRPSFAVSMSERARLGADLASAEAERERAERARAAIGRFRMVGRAGQEEAARHERAAAQAASRARDLIAQLADSGRRREDLMARAAERERWHQERLPQILARSSPPSAISRPTGTQKGAMRAPLAGRPGPELAAAARTLSDARALRPPDPRSRSRACATSGGALSARSAPRPPAGSDTRSASTAGVRRLTRAGREEARQLRATIERSEQAQSASTPSRPPPARTASGARAGIERRERWERDLAPALSGRAEALEGEIARRVEARLADIEHSRPAT